MGVLVRTKRRWHSKRIVGPSLCVLVFWCRDAGPSLAENVTCSEMDYTLDEENAAAAYYDNEEDYRTFHYLGNQMKVKRQQAEAA